MRWDKTEFLLKGMYLGLLLMVALHGPSWVDVAWVGLFTFGGLVLSMTVAAVQKWREGYRPRGRLFGYVLFLLLENPGLVYTGLVAGLAVGAYITFKDQANELDLYALAGGAALGIVLYFLRTVRARSVRLWLGLALAAALVGAALYVRFEYPATLSAEQLQMIPVLLLIGLPGFYLLTFASLVEESEVEIAAMCAALGVALGFLGERFGSAQLGTVALAIPLVIYILYTRRVLPGLRVFKHALRGLSYAKVGQYRPALISLNRALELDPQYPLARTQLWNLHKEMDIDKLKKEPETLALVNYDLCLERVSWLLLLEKPSPAQVEEALHLLELVAGQKPNLEPRCAYWRAVAYLHQRHYEQAAESLASVLRDTGDDGPQRRAVLFQAWQLALVLHPEMHKRVGTPLLAHPGRRMDAIAAVERRLALKPDDPTAWDLKRLLYAPLTEAEYDTAALPDQAVLDFDHAYAQELGLAVLQDRQRWQRGCEYLRLAARGLPLQAPTIYVQLAKTHEEHGDTEGLWHHYRGATQVGRKAGILANLKEEDRTALFTAVKLLGEHEMNVGNIDAALDAFKFYSQYDRAGLETYRVLAELFQRNAENCSEPKDKQDNLWMALHCTEHALTYNPGDRDLIERKDRYYYSITPGDLKGRLEQVRKWFDIDYCLEKSRWVLEKYNGDLDLLDWGGHLIELARTAEPGMIQAKVLEARIRRLKGDINLAVAGLEEIRQNKPEKFAGEEEEAWFLAHRLLGDMYLEEKPDQAVLCFEVYRNSERAGADTMFKLGRAYENLGDFRRAAKYYEHVTAFEGHPLYYEAQEGISRVKRSGNPVG
jgi:tetratricopeptide (TPR) repeat protein